MELKVGVMKDFEVAKQVLEQNGFVKQKKRSKQNFGIWELTISGLLNIHSQPYTKIYTVMLGEKGYAHDPYGWIKIMGYNGENLTPQNEFVTWELAQGVLNN